MEVSKQVRNHFVLVHGACHGAWCWYTLKPLLESAGQRVTALDLAASGVNTKTIQELRSFHDYTLPLLELVASLPEGEKVVLVGHSLGGLNVALVTDRYPDKVSVAVFLTAFMPDSIHQPSYVLEELFKRTSPETWMDTEFEPYGTPGEPLTSMFFGPKILTTNLYQLCSAQDLTLAKMLIRPGSLFLEDLAKADKFTAKGYESVTRVYIVCDQDRAITEEFQRWMIENCGVEEVKEINGADHMPMLSKPQQLCDCLIQIASQNY